jgi:hypothetical protein
MMKFVRLIPALALVVVSMPRTAFAYDGVVEGTLKYVHIKSNNQDQALMVELAGSPSLCGSGRPAQAYLDATALAFQQMVSVATAAHLSGRAVTLYADYNSTLGLCVLKQIRVS